MRLNKDTEEIKETEETQATKIFTDRIEPREAFWNMYNKMNSNIKNIEDVYILNYYGIGGIGKSCLLSKLENELKEKGDICYTSYDFEGGKGVYIFLKSLRSDLIEKYHFDFPKFDVALFCYAKKMGNKLPKEDIQSMVEKSRILSIILDATSLVPSLSVASSLIKLADSGVAWVRNLTSKEYKTEVTKLENQNAEEILKKLPIYFALDMRENLKKINNPFVIFIDTYEMLVDTIGEDKKSIVKDLWLRGDNGLVLNIPKVLWVIAGREKLSWDRIDKEWRDSIDSHALGDLAFTDADWFLSEAGFEDENLRKEIYNLTNGTPVYLDLCVNTLKRLQNNGEEVTIEKFRKKYG